MEENNEKKGQAKCTQSKHFDVNWKKIMTKYLSKNSKNLTKEVLSEFKAQCRGRRNQERQQKEMKIELGCVSDTA